MHEYLAIMQVARTKYELEMVTGKKAHAVAKQVYVLRDLGFIEQVGMRGKQVEWQTTELGLKELTELYADLPVRDETATTWKLFSTEADKDNLKILELTEYFPDKESAMHFISIADNMANYYRALICLAVISEETTYLNSLK